MISFYLSKLNHFKVRSINPLSTHDMFVKMCLFDASSDLGGRSNRIGWDILMALFMGCENLSRRLWQICIDRRRIWR